MATERRRFTVGAGLTPNISSAAPAIASAESYSVIVVSRGLSGRERISSRDGGSVFEDPFYALQLSKTAQSSPPGFSRGL